MRVGFAHGQNAEVVFEPENDDDRLKLEDFLARHPERVLGMSRGCVSNVITHLKIVPSEFLPDVVGVDCNILTEDRVFSERIKSEAMSGDNEIDHRIADDLLCELLVAIGCSESVVAFQAVGKWYA